MLISGESSILHFYFNSLLKKLIRKGHDVTSAVYSHSIARGANVFAKPAAAATYAGLKKAVKEGKVKDTETVVLFITGNGLKDIQSAMKSVGKPFIIKPELPELKKLLTNNKIL